jgi:hypothetical protein
MEKSFQQLPTNTPVDTGEEIVLEVLSILAIATAEVKQKQPSELIPEESFFVLLLTLIQ